MDLTNIIQQLRSERDKISLAIASIEAIYSGSLAPRRGRPPKNSLTLEADVISPASPATRGKHRKQRTAEQRAAQAERMRKYWAGRKAQGEQLAVAPQEPR